MSRLQEKSKETEERIQHLKSEEEEKTKHIKAEKEKLAAEEKKKIMVCLHVYFLIIMTCSHMIVICFDNQFQCDIQQIEPTYSNKN